MVAESVRWRHPPWISFLDETKLIVSGLSACVVFCTRSAGVACFLIGAALCSVSVKLLKKAFRQPRPSQMPQRKLTYGMPSTHSATICFFATYVTLACIYLPLHPSIPSGSWSRIFPPLVAFPWATLVVLSRVWLGYHTWPQVTVGASYGIAFASAWFALWYGGLSEYGQELEQSLNSWIK